MAEQNNAPAGQQDALAPQVSAKDKSLILAILVTLLIMAALAVAGLIFVKQGPDTVQGQCDATEVRVSGKLPGRVVNIFVQEGQYVKAGDTLIHIHSSLAEAKLAQAQAMVEVASATNQKVDAGTRRQIIAGARDLWEQAQAASGITKKTYDRMQKLFEEGVISEQKRDEAKAAKSQYDLAVAGAQKEDKEAAAAMVQAAKGGVTEVDAVLEDQYLTAPCDGQITVIYPNVSELVATGAPLMSLQKDDHWAVFNVRENLLKDIKLGEDIKVRIPALDVETTMRVFYIRDLGTYANWQATKSTGDYDARTFEVKARPAKPIKDFRPGMSVILVQ